MLPTTVGSLSDTEHNVTVQGLCIKQTHLSFLCKTNSIHSAKQRRPCETFTGKIATKHQSIYKLYPLIS